MYIAMTWYACGVNSVIADPSPEDMPSFPFLLLGGGGIAPKQVKGKKKRERGDKD